MIGEKHFQCPWNCGFTGPETEYRHGGDPEQGALDWCPNPECNGKVVFSNGEIERGDHWLP